MNIEVRIGGLPSPQREPCPRNPEIDRLLQRLGPVIASFALTYSSIGRAAVAAAVEFERLKVQRETERRLFGAPLS